MESSIVHLPFGVEGQQKCNEMQIILPVKQPLGYIVVENGSLFAFGLLPPEAEATAVKDPGTWKEVKVCPPASILAATGRVLNCPVDFCNEQIKKNNTYENHIIKHLNLIAREQYKITRLHEPKDLPQNLRIRYYCNEIMCYSGLEMFDQSRCFKRLKYLKQHYLKVHAPKTFGCSSCSKSFATLALLGVHMRNCGNSFECSSCPTMYDTLEALQTHCRRKNHSYNYGKYKDILDTTKLETMAIRQADKDLKLRFASEADPKKALPAPVHVLIPRPTAITTCGPRGATSHVSWTYDTGTDVPKLKVEMSTQTDLDDESPVSSSSSAKVNLAVKKNPATRKRSAETQTGRLKYKISTETQTLNVTKRRRTSKRHIAEAETQCSVTEPNLPLAANEIEINNEFGLPESISYTIATETVETTNKGVSPLNNLPVDASDMQDSGISLQLLMSLVGIEGEPEIEIAPSDQQLSNNMGNIDIFSTINRQAEHEHEINWNNFHSVAVSTSTSEMCVGNNSEEEFMDELFTSEELHRETQTDPTLQLNEEGDFEDLFDPSVDGNDINEMLNLVTTETQTGYGIFSVGSDFNPTLTHSLLPVDVEWNTDSFAMGSQTEFFSTNEEYPTISTHECNRNSPSYMETIDGETQTGFDSMRFWDNILNSE